MNNKEFLALTLAEEFLKQKSNNAICKLLPIVGLKFFSVLITTKELQGMHLVFPKPATLRRVLMRAKIRDELQGLKGEKFKAKVKELANLFGKDRCQIRNEFAVARGYPRKKNY